VGVKALNAISNFSGTIEVEKLGTNALLQSRTLVVQSGTNNEITGKTQLSELLPGSEIKDRVSMTINAPGMKKAVTLSFSKDANIDSVIQEINSKTGVSAYLDPKSGTIALSSKSSGDGVISILKENKLRITIKLIMMSMVILLVY